MSGHSLEGNAEQDSLERGRGDFGAAIRALKAGHRVARAGWNGKGMWLALSGVPGGRLVEADKFWSSHNEDFARASGGSAVVLPCITMKTATGEILMGWLASQMDMLAEDWAIVPPRVALDDAPASDRAHDDLGRVA